jgi:hypothetical protein
MARRNQPAPGGNVIAFDRERRRPRVSAPAVPAPEVAAGDPDEATVMMLTDALVLLFHLRAANQSTFVCRELEQAVRIAVAQRPMAETVDVSAGAWAVIVAVDLQLAIASCRERFDAEWVDD